MKKALTAGLLLCLVLAPGRPWAAEEGRIVHFTLFLKNGAVIHMDSRQKRLNIESSAFDIALYEKNGETFRDVRTLEWPEITRQIYAIEFINTNRAVYTKSKLLLTRQDDSQTVVPYGSLYYTDGTPLDTFHYSEYNRIAGRWTRASVPLELVKKVVLGTTRLMVNPKTGALYPPDYRYDPYSGTPLAESALKED